MDFMELAEQLMYAVIAVCVPILVKFGVAFLQQKIKELQEHVNSDYFNQMIDEIEVIAYKAMNMVAQTYVDSLKQDGVFDAEAQVEAMEKALEATKAALTPEALELLHKKYGDVDAYLRLTIESMIKESK